MGLSRSFPQMWFLLTLLFLLVLISPSTQGAGPVTHDGVPFSKTWQLNAYTQQDGVSLASDSAGNIYVGGLINNGNFQEALLLKYNSTRSLAWSREWRQGCHSAAVGVTTDGSNYAYLTGWAHNLTSGGCIDPISGDLNLLLLKFDSQGNLVWQRTWGGDGNERGSAIASSPSGDIYVTGYSQNLTTFDTVGVLLKFNSSGNLVWQKTWGAGGYDAGNGMALDSSGDIYVVGMTQSSGAGGFDAAILKFDTLGDMIWQRTWGGSRDDFGFGIALDQSGNIIVTGSTRSLSSGDNDLFLLKVDPSGNLLWQRVWGRAGSDSGNGVAVNADGTMIVAGHTGSFGNLSKALLLGFDSSGSLLWARALGGSSDIAAVDLIINSGGNVLAVGAVSGPSPYTLGSVALPLVTPVFSLGSASNLTGSLGIAPATLNGTLSTLPGNETYACTPPPSVSCPRDTLLFQYNPPIPTSIACWNGLTCVIQSDSFISNADFTGGTLNFIASGTPGSNGYANITLPRISMLPLSGIQVSVNNSRLPTSDLITGNNQTQNFVYFRLPFNNTLNLALSFSSSTAIAPLLPIAAALTVSAVLIIQKKRVPKR